ncbi:MAG: KWG repeat-containing protein [Bacteroidetes bacterium]|nr:MAG: KWG repeat-containing protein [Bacteroidota bacterium]
MNTHNPFILYFLFAAYSMSNCGLHQETANEKKHNDEPAADPVAFFYHVKTASGDCFIDESGKNYWPAGFYKTTGHWESNRLPIIIGEKKGYVNWSGDTIIPPVFSETYSFEQGYAFARQDQLWGVIDTGGKWVIPPQYHHIRYADDKKATLYKNKGDVQIPFEMYSSDTSLYLSWFDSHIESGTLMVKRNGTWSSMNLKTGKIAAWVCDSLNIWSEKKIAVRMNSGWGFADTAGNMKVPAIYQKVGNFQEGFAPVVLAGKWGYIDTSGKIVIPALYEKAQPFTKGYGKVKTGSNAYNLVTSSGKLLFEKGFTNVRTLGNEIFAVLEADLWYLVDEKGRKISKPGLEDISDYESGVAFAKQNKLWGLIDNKGKWLAPPRFSDHGYFVAGTAGFKTTSGWGLIDTNGKIVQEPVLDNILHQYKNGVVLVKKQGNQLLRNKSGIIIWQEQ